MQEQLETAQTAVEAAEQRVQKAELTYQKPVSYTHLDVYKRQRSARLDILAVDEQNKAYNIEIQRNDRGAEVRRCLLYTSRCV